MQFKARLHELICAIPTINAYTIDYLKPSRLDIAIDYSTGEADARAIRYVSTIDGPTCTFSEWRLGGW
jgi:hypothetical protein